MRQAKSKPVFNGLSAAARLVGVSEQTLLRYSKVGIVNPDRDSTGRRLFTDADIERARAFRDKQRALKEVVA
jgi:DNA-binding transcriptional MerR regulator